MFVRLLPCSFHRIPKTDNLPPSQPLTSFVVRGAGGAGPFAIDAGSLGLVGEAEDMARVREVLLTHAHIDHIATLPMWIEALLSQNRAPVKVHASAGTIQALRQHFFNNVIFPNFEELKEEDGRALMELVEIPVDRAFELAGFQIKGFDVAHPVPTTGYYVTDGEAGVIFAADSGPTDRLWEVASKAPNVRAIVLETSFPDWMGHIAESAGHLTPNLLKRELEKAPENTRILITHMKPAYRGEILRSIGLLEDRRIQFIEPGVDVEI